MTPMMQFMCHCSICRKASGVQGMAVVIVPKNRFEWLKGKEYITEWTKPGHDWQTRFCKNCGSALPGDNDEKQYYVPAGLIVEGVESLQVSHHIFLDSKAPWFQVCDAGKRHLHGFNE